MARWFLTLVNTKSPTLDPRVGDEVKGRPACVQLDDVPSMLEVDQATRGTFVGTHQDFLETE